MKINIKKSKVNNSINTPMSQDVLNDFERIKTYYHKMIDKKYKFVLENINIINDTNKNTEISVIKAVMMDLTKLEQNLNKNILYLQENRTTEDHRFALVTFVTEIIRYDTIFYNLKFLLTNYKIPKTSGHKKEISNKTEKRGSHEQTFSSVGKIPLLSYLEIIAGIESLKR